MLKNIDPRLSPDLLRDLAILGHNESVLIADQNFPMGKITAPVHYIPLPTTDVLSAVLSVFPLEVSSEECIKRMSDPSAPLDEAATAALEVIRRAEPDFAGFHQPVLAFDQPELPTGFLHAALQARVAIVTGDIAYSSYILRRGLTL